MRTCELSKTCILWLEMDHIYIYVLAACDLAVRMAFTIQFEYMQLYQIATDCNMNMLGTLTRTLLAILILILRFKMKMKMRSINATRVSMILILLYL